MTNSITRQSIKAKVAKAIIGFMEKYNYCKGYLTIKTPSDTDANINDVFIIPIIGNEPDYCKSMYLYSEMQS